MTVASTLVSILGATRMLGWPVGEINRIGFLRYSPRIRASAETLGQGLDGRRFIPFLCPGTSNAPTPLMTSKILHFFRSMLALFRRQRAIRICIWRGVVGQHKGDTRSRADVNICGHLVHHPLVGWQWQQRQQHQQTHLHLLSVVFVHSKASSAQMSPNLSFVFQNYPQLSR